MECRTFIFENVAPEKYALSRLSKTATALARRMSKGEDAFTARNETQVRTHLEKHILTVIALGMFPLNVSVGIESSYSFLCLLNCHVPSNILRRPFEG